MAAQVHSRGGLMGTVRLAAQPGKPPNEGDPLALLPLLGHELRTPLTALKGQVQLMQRRLRRDEGRDADLADLERMASLLTRMNHQIDVIVDAARLAQDALNVSPEQMDLTPIIQRAVSWHQSSFLRRTITVELPAEPLMGWWDGRLIGHVTYELLANGIRFSPQGGDLAVRALAGDGHLRVEIADQGIGVAEDERDAIFAYGRRGSNAETYGGAGLGLYVARGIVSRHGGDSGVEPRPGGGSTFWFTLPL
jgi:signal transduction histidine kinase